MFIQADIIDTENKSIIKHSEESSRKVQKARKLLLIENHHFNHLFEQLKDKISVVQYTVRLFRNFTEHLSFCIISFDIYHLSTHW